MPRIPTSILRRAYAEDIFLPPLLGTCRDLHAAQNELRWLREHVEKVAEARRLRGGSLSKGALLRHLVKERRSGRPLQYLLGSEYFGNLEIRCRPDVLIPRADTASSVTHLVGLLRKAQNLPLELRVLDLCTGTGCIPLLFHHEFYSARRDVVLRILGADISDKALRLANHNLGRTRRTREYVDKGSIQFLKADVLTDPFQDHMQLIHPPFKTAINLEHQPSFWDVLISNPPYISPAAYWKTTARSVRGHEPKLALVPPSKANYNDTAQGDQFYPRLLDIARDVEAKVVLFEVGDMEQATRVAEQARKRKIFDGIEIWRDQPDGTPDEESEIDGISVIGSGNARSVLCWRSAGASWLGKEAPVSQAEDARRLFWGSHTQEFGENNPWNEWYDYTSRFKAP